MTITYNITQTNKKKPPALLFASAEAKETTQLETILVYNFFSIAITSLGEERANLRAFRTFVGFALVWFCLFPLPLGIWEGLWFVIVALPGLFSYLLFFF